MRRHAEGHRDPSLIDFKSQPEAQKVDAVIGQPDVRIAHVTVGKGQACTLGQIRNTDAHFVAELEVS